MCCYNPNTNFVKLIGKAITDPTVRERFLTDPTETANNFGFSNDDQKELSRYSLRKLKALVNGPSTHH